MKIAIVHDYIKEYGGAEKVLEELHAIFPKAPIYTSVYLPSYLGPHRDRFEEMDIRASFLQKIPFIAKLISPIRLISPWVFKSFNFNGFDVVLVSQTGAYFPHALNKKNAKLISYTHTPPRYLYGYKTARNISKNKVFYLLAHIMNHFLRIVDFNTAQNVDVFIANSEEVRSRIKKFYRRSAQVIYPPVVVSSLTASSVSPAQSYYLTGGRLARAKGTDVVIRAFNKNGKKLKIFGKGFAGFEEELKVLSKNNIEFVGEVSNEEKFSLMTHAQAFIFSSFDEDFGITPVESMMLGTPVIAFKSGGVQETVREGVSGIFYEENSPEKLNETIEKFESPIWQKKLRKTSMQQVTRRFSLEEFQKNIQHAIRL